MISDEYQIKAAFRMMEAAESMRQSADRMEAVLYSLNVLLGDGYGNNVERLIQLLSQQNEQSKMDC